MKKVIMLVCALCTVALSTILSVSAADGVTVKLLNGADYSTYTVVGTYSNVNTGTVITTELVPNEEGIVFFGGKQANANYSKFEYAVKQNDTVIVAPKTAYVGDLSTLDDNFVVQVPLPKAFLDEYTETDLVPQTTEINLGTKIVQENSMGLILNPNFYGINFDLVDSSYVAHLNIEGQKMNITVPSLKASCEIASGLPKGSATVVYTTDDSLIYVSGPSKIALGLTKEVEVTITPKTIMQLVASSETDTDYTINDITYNVTDGIKFAVRPGDTYTIYKGNTATPIYVKVPDTAEFTVNISNAQGVVINDKVKIDETQNAKDPNNPYNIPATSDSSIKDQKLQARLGNFALGVYLIIMLYMISEVIVSTMFSNRKGTQR